MTANIIVILTCRAFIRAAWMKTPPGSLFNKFLVTLISSFSSTFSNKCTLCLTSRHTSPLNPLAPLLACKPNMVNTQHAKHHDSMLTPIAQVHCCYSRQPRLFSPLQHYNCVIHHNTVTAAVSAMRSVLATTAMSYELP